jgi:signal transduction histidine kinase
MVLHEESQLRVLFRFIQHEMTSATTGLHAYLAFIAADPADEVAVALRATVTKLHALSQRLVVLSQDGQAALRRAYVDLRTVVESEAAQLRTQGAHLAVTTSLPDAPALVWADPTLLAMAVGTALRNAAEAYDPLTVTVPIAVRLTVTATAAELTIADQGPGFPVELLTAIAAARPVLGWTTKAHGSGTGVSLILGVAQLHGGWAAFCNRPEGGASVTITLPLAASAPDGVLPNAAPAERSP